MGVQGLQGYRFGVQEFARWGGFCDLQGFGVEGSPELGNLEFTVHGSWIRIEGVAFRAHSYKPPHVLNYFYREGRQDCRAASDLT